MALQLVKETENGINAEYWALTEIKVNDQEIHATLSLFVSEVLKKEGKAALEIRTFKFEHDKAVTATENIYQKVYNKIKESNIVNEVEQNEFASALDV